MTTTTNHPLVEGAAEIFAALLRHPNVRAALAELAPKAQPAPVAPEGLVSKAELARMLDLSVSTIDRHDRDGAPYEYAGTRRRYNVAARRAWLQARGRFVSKPTPPKVADDVDVSDVMSRNGLTVVTGGRR